MMGTARSDPTRGRITSAPAQTAASSIISSFQLRRAASPSSVPTSPIVCDHSGPANRKAYSVPLRLV